MNSGIPTQKSISNILFDGEACKKWLVNNDIIWKIRICGECHKEIMLSDDLTRYRHWCNDGKKKDMRIFKNTFFSRVKIPCNELMNVIYFWLQGAGYTFIKNVTGHSSQFVTNIINNLNELVAMNVNEEKLKIGGPGIIVEIDESKLSKRKYNRGHHVDGVWVVGGVERTAERKLFVVEVENRNAETLKEIIEEYVIHGSIIYTDCWRGYNFLNNNENFTHQTVNHSVAFIDPITNVHTNTIEGTWSGLKNKIPKRNRTKTEVGNHILSFIWRRQNEGNLWNRLLDALRDYYCE